MTLFLHNTISIPWIYSVIFYVASTGHQQDVFSTPTTINTHAAVSMNQQI